MKVVDEMLVGVDASRATTEGRTGTEVYSLSLLRELIVQSAGRRLRFYFRQAEQVGLFPDEGVGWEARVIPFPRLWTHIRLSLEMLVAPPDVLFVPAHVVPLMRPRGTVVSVHDLGYLHYPQMHRRAEAWYLDWSTRFNCRVAARVLALSESTKRDLVSCYGVPAGKIVTVYPGLREGVAREGDSAAARSVRQRYGIEAPYFLYVGTLQPRKNLPRLLEAYQHLLGTWQDTDGEVPLLVLAGKPGWGATSLLATAERLGVACWVRWTGYVPDEDLPALYGGALGFLFPSLYEGFGLPILEAMACGAPVLCSDTSACGEVGEGAALLVDPLSVDQIAAGMLRLARDGELRRQLAAIGPERAAAYTWQKAAAQVWDVLAEVDAEQTPVNERAMG
jgi:glycosyltransferase involved in cell wall biosynthesis